MSEKYCHILYQLKCMHILSFVWALVCMGE